jgi:hypothetical protein
MSRQFSRLLILTSVILLLNLTQQKLEKKKRVLNIGIDGLLQTCMNEADTSAFEFMIENGSYTFEARTAIETISAAGWSNILCGMQTELTGMTTDDWFPTDYYQKINRISPVMGYDNGVPCIFREMRSKKADIKMTSVFNWDWFLYMGNTFYPDTLNEEHLFLCGDPSCGKKADYDTMTKGLELLGKDWDFFFLYIGNLDWVGHDSGWCKENYIIEISVVNNYVESIFERLRELGIMDDTYIFINTDHGGTYHQPWHGEMNDDNLIVPWFVKGPGIKKNHQIKSHLKDMDTAPTIMKIFGLEPNPFWKGRIVDEIFE